MRLLALPAELYPHIRGCAGYFLFNFLEGCVTASTGLPAELYPHMQLQWTTHVIIAYGGELVNRFLKNIRLGGAEGIPQALRPLPCRRFWWIM